MPTKPGDPSPETRLSHGLRALLTRPRVAALGTRDAAGFPFVSMVPFAVVPGNASLVIHVSALAAHTRYLQATPQVSLLIMQSELPQAPVHALPRVTLQGIAQVLTPDSAAWTDARAAYLTRFPDAQPMTEFDDFMFVSIQLQGARQIAGFGAARSLDADEVAEVLGDLA